MTGISILLVFSTGLGLGAIFYGGLWLTVRGLPTARNPLVFTLASFWIRTLLVLAGFLLVATGSWSNGLIFLAGFTTGRFAVSRCLPVQEARHKCL